MMFDYQDICTRFKEGNVNQKDAERMKEIAKKFKEIETKFKNVFDNKKIE